MFNIHWIPQHRNIGDRDLFMTLRPRFIKVVWDGEPAYAEDVLAAGAGYLYRDYQLSENWGSRDLVSVSAAAQIGQDHARYLQDINKELLRRGMAQDRIWYEGLNEPHVWTEAEKPARVAAYYAAFARGLHRFGARAVVGNFGVGWPGNVWAGRAASPEAPAMGSVLDGGFWQSRLWTWQVSTQAQGGSQPDRARAADQPVNWKPYRPMFEAMITQGGYTDFLGVHEYWGYNGENENWGWWGGRILQLPFNVPVLVTECGIDGGVIGQWMKGWGGLPGNRDEQAARYCRELWRYMELLRKDQRIQGVFVFTYDGTGEDWGEFNLKDWPFLNALSHQTNTSGIPQPHTYNPSLPAPPNPIVTIEPQGPPGPELLTQPPVPPQPLGVSPLTQPPKPEERAWGIGVSEKQSDADWQAAEAAGVSFAFIRQTYGLTLDQRCYRHVNRSSGGSILRGSIHLLGPLSGAVQARFAHAVYTDLGCELPLILGVMDAHCTVKQVRRFLERWHELSDIRPLVSTRKSAWERIVGESADWVSQWADLCVADRTNVDAPELPDAWARWIFWQRAQQPVQGLVQPVDLNWFNGTVAELLAWARGEPSPERPEPEPGKWHISSQTYVDDPLMLLIGAHPVAGIAVIVTDPWGNEQHSVSGSKPEHGAGAWEARTQHPGTYAVSFAGERFEVEVRAGQTCRVVWLQR